MSNTYKEHAYRYFRKGLHLDGRALETVRDVHVEFGVTKSAEGSARVRIGGTEVIAGVKMQLETPYPDTPEEGNLSVNVELLPLSSPEFETGPPGILATEIARVVDRGIRESNVIDRKKLCVAPGEKVWSVMIDVCTLNDAGNLFDACALAASAALKDTRFPGIVNGAVNYDERTDTPLPLSGLPVSITVYKLGDHLVVDPTSDEEKLVDARLTVASTEDGTLVAFQKGGDVALTSDEICTMVDLAQRTAEAMRTHIEG